MGHHHGGSEAKRPALNVALGGGRAPGRPAGLHCAEAELDG